MLFEKTFGKTYKFYGVYDTSFKIGPHVFEAVEGESDGYRSYLDTIESVKDEKLVFLGRSFATVRVEEYNVGDFQGYALIDVKDRHHWLEVGTNYVDDYYPTFVFRYQTKEQLKERQERIEASQAKSKARTKMQQQLAAIQEAMRTGDLGDAEKMLDDLVKKL